MSDWNRRIAGEAATAQFKRIEELEKINADLLAACKEFVRKCECGEARSVRSYAQMKAAIAKAEGGKSNE